MKNRVNTQFLIILMAVVLVSCTKKDSESESTTHLPTLLDLGAQQCQACKAMTPVLAELETQYEGTLNVEFIDVWQPENREKANEYKIRSIPTQIFIDSAGKELWRHQGFISTADIILKWKQLGITLEKETK